MLVISRKVGESIVISDNIELTVIETSKDKVKIGINAPMEVKIKRKELYITEKENINASKNISEDTMKLIINDTERCDSDVISR